jgi:hypothetical protein
MHKKTIGAKERMIRNDKKKKKASRLFQSLYMYTHTKEGEGGKSKKKTVRLIDEQKRNSFVH